MTIVSMTTVMASTMFGTTKLENTHCALCDVDVVRDDDYVVVVGGGGGRRWWSWWWWWWCWWWWWWWWWGGDAGGRDDAVFMLVIVILLLVLVALCGVLGRFYRNQFETKTSCGALDPENSTRTLPILALCQGPE